MCHSVYIVTDIDADLSIFNSEIVTYDKVKLNTTILSLPYKWHVGYKHGCSCHFRRLMPENVDALGFAEPQDWYKEDPQNIESTKELYKTLKWILEHDGKLELIDSWNDEDMEGVLRREIALSEVPEDKFRLFERHLFVISK